MSDFVKKSDLIGLCKELRIEALELSVKISTSEAINRNSFNPIAMVSKRIDIFKNFDVRRERIKVLESCADKIEEILKK